MSLWSAYSRDADATRTGPVELLAGSDFTIRFNAVGVWSAVCAYSDDMWGRVEPGGGLILRRAGQLICNGPITSYGYDVTVDSSTGQYDTVLALEGVTDEIVLADRIVLPDPARSPTDQTTQSHWRMTGPAEDVLCALVDTQAGPGARPERRTAALTVAPSQHRGAVVAVAIRYGAPNMLAELQTIARAGGGLGFRVVATAAGGRRFEVYEPSTRPGRVRYGTEMGNVADQTYRTGAPTLTYADVGGGGEATARLQVDHISTDPEALAWRRRIETYVDGRDTTDTTELLERGVSAVDDGKPTQSYSFTPIDTDNARLLEHVNLGDRVTVYAGPPGGRRVSTFHDLVREIHGELQDDDDLLQAAVGSEGASTGVPLPSVELLLRIRADLQALKGAT